MIAILETELTPHGHNLVKILLFNGFKAKLIGLGNHDG
jgi:hypothetical protein